MKRIAVFTSGGDAPGMNACVRAIVRSASKEGVEVFCIKQGYQGMIEGDISRIYPNDVANIIQRGGTILKSARSEEFKTKEGRQKAFQNLSENNIEGLICIGGNGTYTGAKIFYEECGIPSVGVPGTIDNDLSGTDFTIGFNTAVRNAVDAIDKIRDTADSHNRIFFVEVMGRDSGYIAMYAGLSTGAEAILIPEIDHDIDYLYSQFESRRKQKGFSIVIVAEGDEMGSASEIASQFKEKFPNTEEKVTVLGHIQRGGSPTHNDRILATQLGLAAVEKLLNGDKNCAVGIVSDKVITTTFEEAINYKKKIDLSMWEMAKRVN
jgi:6-phosphofructokinase 1